MRDRWRGTLDMAARGDDGAAAGGVPAAFISYASHDVAVANRIVETLERHGVPCWIAPRNVRGGESYAAAIVQAISGCRMLVLVLSRSAIDSAHVLREVERASSKNRPILSVRMDGAALTPDLEYFLSTNHWLDASGGSIEQVLPAIIDSVQATGGRHAVSAEPVASAQLKPRARFAPPASARVPGRLEELIGRERELEQIDGLLRAHRAVTLVGAGGIGKTECALEYARRAAEYPDGIWFSDLAPMHKAADWLESLGLSLSIAPSEPAALIEKIAALLADRRALLLLDNCDRIAAEVGACLVELLRRTEHLRILATSQQQLDFTGESILRVPPLALPSVAVLKTPDALRAVASTPAMQLLLTRIRAVHSYFEIDARNVAPLVEICRALDGMPLALELAATRFALLSADQVLDRLHDRFKFLVGDVSGRDTRHQTLSALLEWSYALLSAEEQRLLRWLGVFLQGWNADVAGDIAGSLALDADRVVDLLTGLVKKSFVVVDLTGAVPRYRLLESIRTFALDKLASRGEEAQARDAHLECIRCLSRAAQPALLSERMADFVARLKSERANIGGALEWARRVGNHEASLEVIGSLLLYIRSHGALAPGETWSADALANTVNAPSRMRSRVLLAQGLTGMHTKAVAIDTERMLAEAWALARDYGDDWALGCAAGYRALYLAECGRADAAVEFVNHAEALAESLGDDWLRGLAGLARGWVDISNGRLREAINALQAVRHLGHDLHQRHFVDMYIGLSLFRLGELRLAAAAWYVSMRNSIQIQQERGMTGSIEGCAYLCAQTGSAEQAVRLLSVAAVSRGRTRQPLFSFWLPHHRSSLEKLQVLLGPDEYRRLSVAAASVRQEDAVNEAFDTLGRFAGRTRGSGEPDPGRP